MTDGKESTCNEGDLSSTPGLGSYPGGGQPTPVLPGGSPLMKELAGLQSVSLQRAAHDWATTHEVHKVKWDDMDPNPGLYDWFSKRLRHRHPGSRPCEDTWGRWLSTSQGKKASKATTSSNILISGFQTPGLWKNKFLSFKHPVLILCCGSPSKLTQGAKYLKAH